VRHVDHMLAEYHDGELSARCCAQIERHLAACPACRAELADLRRLSRVVNDCPLPGELTAPETFRAQVMLRLPRRALTPATDVPWVWFAVPVALMCAVLLLQGVWGVSRGVLVVIEVLGRSDLVEWTRFVVLPGMNDLLRSSTLDLARVAWYAVLYTVLVALFVLYMGWVNVLARAFRRVPVVEGEANGSR